MISKIDCTISQQVEIDTMENKVAFDKSRAALYHFLGILYLRETTPEFLETLEHSGFFTTSNDGKTDFPNFDGDKSDHCELLEAEYARLFVGPGHYVPPYGSVYREDDSHPGTLWGSTTTEIKRFIEHYGLNVDGKGFIPDHIGVLFEFMAILIEGGLKAQSENDIEKTGLAETLQRRFFSEYIGSWVDHFLSRVKQANQSPFYSSVVNWTEQFMHDEREILSSAGES